MKHRLKSIPFGMLFVLFIYFIVALFESHLLPKDNNRHDQDAENPRQDDAHVLTIESSSTQQNELEQQQKQEKQQEKQKQKQKQQRAIASVKNTLSPIATGVVTRNSQSIKQHNTVNVNIDGDNKNQNKNDNQKDRDHNNHNKDDKHNLDLPEFFATQTLHNQDISFGETVLGLQSDSYHYNYELDNNGNNNNDDQESIAMPVKKIENSKHLSLVVLVTYRETFMGCGDYELFLSPHFETIFCLPYDYAIDWQIDKLVSYSNNYSNITRGAHLLLHKQLRGEFWCRQEAVKYIENNNLIHLKPIYGKQHSPKYFASWNCDVRPWNIEYQTSIDKYEYARPYIDDLQVLMWTYEKEMDRRLNKVENLPIPRDPDEKRDILNNERKYWPLFGVTPTLWEQWAVIDGLGYKKIPKKYENETFIKKLHYHPGYGHWTVKTLEERFGYDYNQHGDKFGINYTYPWVSDVLFFSETHGILYHYDTLKIIIPDYFIPNLECFLTEPQTMMSIMVPKYNYTLVRSNQVNVPMNFGVFYSELANSAMKNEDTINLTKYWEWKILAFQRLPERLTNQWMAAYKRNIIIPVIWGAGFFAGHWTDIWLPFDQFIGFRDISKMYINGKMKNKYSNEMKRNSIETIIYTMIEPMMNILGYYLIGENKNKNENDNNTYYVFEMTRVYPPSVYVTMNNVLNKSLSNLFVKIETPIWKESGDKNGIVEDVIVDYMYSHPWRDGKDEYKYGFAGLSQMPIEERRIYFNKASHINYIKKFATGLFEIYRGQLNGDVFKAFVKFQQNKLNNYSQSDT